MLGKTGFDTIEVAAKPGVTPEQLARPLRRALPATRRRSAPAQERGAPAVRRHQATTSSFLTTFLLAFACISLFVGAFIIFNTFSITVAQRTREFALLRTLGASRGQVLRSVIGEGAAARRRRLGARARCSASRSRRACKALFSAVRRRPAVDGTRDRDAHDHRLARRRHARDASLSSLAPALRATRVPPIAALREGAAPPAGRARRAGCTIAARDPARRSASALIALGLFGGGSTSAALQLVGVGAAADVHRRRAAQPVARRGRSPSVVGRPIERVRGVTGRLARENTTRQPGRTAVDRGRADDRRRAGRRSCRSSPPARKATIDQRGRSTTSRRA